jgi:hypothetical protein
MKPYFSFCEDVIVVFDRYYLREPNTKDIARLLSIKESRRFPGMLGRIDCTHWQWRNYLLVGKGSSKAI